jgi:hypothetical protein
MFCIMYLKFCKILHWQKTVMDKYIYIIMCVGEGEIQEPIIPYVS